VLIAWDRLVTTDGQSVLLAAYGTDRIGRSGLPGTVRNHFLQRFGTAALISLIGAVPTLAADKYAANEVASDTAENVGTDLGEAVNDGDGRLSQHPADDQRQPGRGRDDPGRCRSGVLLMSYLDTYLGQLDAALSDPAVMELAINADGSIWLERAGQIHMTPSGLAALPAGRCAIWPPRLPIRPRTPSRNPRLWSRQRCGIAI
jgi:hypothetical protein